MTAPRRGIPDRPDSGMARTAQPARMRCPRPGARRVSLRGSCRRDREYRVVRVARVTGAAGWNPLVLVMRGGKKPGGVDVQTLPVWLYFVTRDAEPCRFGLFVPARAARKQEPGQHEESQERQDLASDSGGSFSPPHAAIEKANCNQVLAAPNSRGFIPRGIWPKIRLTGSDRSNMASMYCPTPSRNDSARAVERRSSL